MTTFTDTILGSWSDSKLYQKCKEYGGNARLWMRKFAGLLPEVQRRHLYKRRGSISIHEFASKLAGMSHETVDKILHLSERLKDKHALKAQLESGSAGWSKIEAVAYIATPETDKMWAEKVTTLSYDALIAYVKEERVAKNNRLDFTGPGELKNNEELLQVASSQSIPWAHLSFPVSPEVEQKLRLFKQKLEKEEKQAVSWNEVFEKMIGQIEQNTTTNNLGAIQKTINICPECVKRKSNEDAYHTNVGRHIAMEVKNIVDNRSGKICEFPKCNRPGEIYHHTRRYKLNQNHDPDYIVYLCKAHERLAHNGLIQGEEKAPKLWKVLQQPDRSAAKWRVDKRVQEFRKEGLLVHAP